MIRSYLRSISIAFALATALLGSSANAGDFVILCNKANNVSSLSKSDLRKLYTGGIKQWGSGAVVQVGLIAGDAPETVYLSGLIGMTPRELIQRIQEQVFKGEMKRPAVLHSPADCAAFARSNPGAICVSAGVPIPPEARSVPVQ